MLLRLSLGRTSAADGDRGRGRADALDDGWRTGDLADPRRTPTTAWSSSARRLRDRGHRALECGRCRSMTGHATGPVVLYDTTLRDGTQGENITLSLADKLRIARMLDEYGMPYIEGGWPGSNPKDIEFFAAARTMRWQTAKLAAFGSTRHRSNRPTDDPNLRELVAAETPVVTIFGKSLAAARDRGPRRDAGRRTST